VNLLRTTRIPSLSASEVSIVLPGDAVLTSITIGIVDSTAAIRPERIVETVVCTSLASSYGLARVEFKVGGGEDPGEGGHANDEFGEGHHGYYS